MHHSVAAGCVAVFLACPIVGRAQSVVEPMPAAASPPITQSPPPNSGITFPLPRIIGATESTHSDAGFWMPFKAIPSDFVRFFSADSLKIVGVGGAGALAAHQWDGAATEESQEHVRPSLFQAGNFGGGFLVQVGTSFGLYSIAKFTGSNDLAALGADLTRAHVLSQGLVHAGKFASHRSRPDGSDPYSLPSGHTASAFATATVLQRHFGWKAGIPAYGFGAYVAASRMSANKHHLSDVVIGAAIGVAAGRTVTVGRGKAQFNLGMTPTPRGAAITFTKR
jgi:hypothetical protein